MKIDSGADFATGSLLHGTFVACKVASLRASVGPVLGSTSLVRGTFSASPEEFIEKLFIEVPLIEVPVIEEPFIDEPFIAVPVIDEPFIEVPVIEVPFIEVPFIEVPAIEVPFVWLDTCPMSWACTACPSARLPATTIARTTFIGSLLS